LASAASPHSRTDAYFAGEDGYALEEEFRRREQFALPVDDNAPF
jgi:hypothetical protein